MPQQPPPIPEDWDAITRKMESYIRWRIRGIGPRGTRSSDDLYRGLAAEDIVQETLCRFLNGSRPHDPTRVSLAMYLKGVASSQLSHMWEKCASNVEVSGYEDDGTVPGKAALHPGAGVRNGWPSRTEPVEQTIIRCLERLAEESDVDRFLEALMTSLGEDPEARVIVEAISAGCEPKPRCLAKCLDIEVKDVNNRLRRLRRRATQIAKGWGPWRP